MHQAVSARFAGVPLIAAQSVAPGLRMPWEADLTATTAPGFAVHALTESGDLTSYLRSLPGPRPGG